MEEPAVMRLDREFFVTSFLICFLATILTSCAEERSPAENPPEAAPAASATIPAVQRSDVEIPETGNLPSDFPSDVPIFPGAVPHHSLSILGDSMMVTFTIDSLSDDVYDFYETHLTIHGWTVSEREKGAHRVRATKDTRSISVMIMATGASTEIMVAIEGL
jgi:hypothetical protein